MDDDLLEVVTEIIKQTGILKASPDDDPRQTAIGFLDYFGDDYSEIARLIIRKLKE